MDTNYFFIGDSVGNQQHFWWGSICKSLLSEVRDTTLRCQQQIRLKGVSKRYDFATSATESPSQWSTMVSKDLLELVVYIKIMPLAFSRALSISLL